MSYVSSDMIKKATLTVPTLSRVLEYTMTGWPREVDPPLATYMSKQNELNVEQGCLLWGLHWTKNRIHYQCKYGVNLVLYIRTKFTLNCKFDIHAMVQT